jgi:arginine decarboxylase
VELSDMYNVLFLLTLGDGESEARTLVAALRDMAANHGGDRDFSALEDIYNNISYPEMPEQVLSPRQALFGDTRTIPFRQAAGKICAEIITFYPPGIPLLCPGERISEDVIEYCERLQEAGLHISGPEDYTLKTVKVVE